MFRARTNAVRWLILLVWAFAGGQVTSCAPAATAQPAPGPEPQVDGQFVVGQREAVVKSGPADPLDELRPPGFRALRQNDRVWTSPETGEAVIKGMLDGKQCRVFLFHRSQFSKRGCPGSTFGDGNRSCLEEGSAVYNACSNHLVMTLSGELRLRGTWAWVAYVPNGRWTLAVLLSGEARAWPVVDSVTRRLGSPASVGSGYFWFSQPGAGAVSIAGLTARSAHPLDRLPAVVDALGLGPWFERVKRQAEEDGVPFPSLPTPALTFTPTPSPTPSATGRPAALCQAVGSQVPLYGVPALASSIVGWLRAGTLLEARGRSVDGRWILVAVAPGGVGGWVVVDPRSLRCPPAVDVDALPLVAVPTAVPTAAAPPVITTFLGTPPAIIAGGCGTLVWNTVNAFSIFLDGVPVAASGRRQVCPAVTTVYTLTSVGRTGQTTLRQTVVQVRPPPPTSATLTATATPEAGTPTPTSTALPPPPSIRFFAADPPSVPLEGCSSLSWQTANADKVSLDGVGVEPMGRQRVCPTSTTRYVLMASDRLGRTDQRVVTVQVTRPEPPTSTPPPPTPIPPPPTPIPPPPTPIPPPPESIPTERIPIPTERISVPDRGRENIVPTRRPLRGPPPTTRAPFQAQGAAESGWTDRSASGWTSP